MDLIKDWFVFVCVVVGSLLLIYFMVKHLRAEYFVARFLRMVANKRRYMAAGLESSPNPAMHPEVHKSLMEEAAAMERVANILEIDAEKSTMKRLKHL